MSNDNLGWIKLWRKFENWEWFKSPDTAHFFIWLLLRASHKDTRFCGHEIKRGQLVFGRRKASYDTGLSVTSVRSCIKRLKSTHEITIKSTSRFSIITLLNYDSYQNKDDESNHQINQQTNQQLTTNQPSSNHIQEVKNVRSKEVVSSKPTLLECKDYFKELLIPLEAEKFFDHFESNGWRVGGKAPMKNWKAAARNWARRKENSEKPIQTIIRQKAKPDSNCTAHNKDGLLENGVKCWCWK